MKLAELLTKITPLPWKIDQHGNVQSDNKRRLSKICVTGFSLSVGSDTKEAEFNNAYVHHAANILPELVACLRDIAEMLDADNEQSHRADDPEGAMDTAFSKAKSALTRAEEGSIAR